MYVYMYVRVCVCVRACMYVCSPIAPERINRFAPNLVRLFLEVRKKIQEGHIFEKIVPSSSPMRAVPVARNLSTIGEQRQQKLV
jgi:hypothetical protein